MFAATRLDDRFLDRPGCGDELYLDSRFRASTWLDRLAGSPNGDRTALDLDFVDDDDDFASH
jgi:hypothetical protein